jgi:hypothetical protein
VVTVSVARVARAFQARFLYVPGTDLAQSVTISASSPEQLASKFVGGRRGAARLACWPQARRAGAGWRRLAQAGAG